jgi:septal ring factor EnvC (AmiA/AmiB activator)
VLVQHGTLTKTQDQLSLTRASSRAAHAELRDTSAELADTRDQLDSAQAKASACAHAVSALQAAGHQTLGTVTKVLDWTNRWNVIFSGPLRTLIFNGISISTLRSAVHAAKACESGGTMAL